jgi:hypothetical protein
MPIINGCQALVDEAMPQVTTHSLAEVQARMADAALQMRSSTADSNLGRFH